MAVFPSRCTMQFGTTLTDVSEKLTSSIIGVALVLAQLTTMGQNLEWKFLGGGILTTTPWVHLALGGSPGGCLVPMLRMQQTDRHTDTPVRYCSLTLEREKHEKLTELV